MAIALQAVPLSAGAVQGARDAQRLDRRCPIPRESLANDGLHRCIACGKALRVARDGHFTRQRVRRPRSRRPARPDRPVARPAVRRGAPRGRGHRVGSLAGQQARVGARAAPRPPCDRGGHLPGGRGRVRRWRPLPTTISRPASTPPGSGRSRRPSATRPADGSGCRSTPVSCWASRGSAPQGLRQRIRIARLQRTHPDVVLAIAGRGRDDERWPRRSADQVPVRFLGRAANDDLPFVWRLRRRVHDALPQPVGRPRAGGVRDRVRRGGGLRRATGRG